ncbi:MAG: 30S ribosomal protein S16 [Actinobacteria bacterium]|nr:30S ribosomal protein S16 [Actinomycetota bacterium]MCL5887538.1 30S ribosomal protein S16 [Actinomycetota bacterium]
MSVRIRLARAGAKRAPFYRVVIADARSPRDGRFIEIVGRYNPRTQPSTIAIDIEKVDEWIAKGAQMSPTVAKLVAASRNVDGPAPEKSERLSKKAQAKAAEQEAEAAKAAEAPAPEEAAEDAGDTVAEADSESAQ